MVFATRTGLKSLPVQTAGESDELSADVYAVSTGVIMTADDELDLVPALGSDDLKHLIGVIDDMTLLNANVKALVAKDPESAALGRGCKNFA